MLDVVHVKTALDVHIAVLELTERRKSYSSIITLELVSIWRLIPWHDILTTAGECPNIKLSKDNDVGFRPASE